MQTRQCLVAKQSLTHSHARARVGVLEIMKRKMSVKVYEIWKSRRRKLDDALNDACRETSFASLLSLNNYLKVNIYINWPVVSKLVKGKLWNPEVHL